MGVTLFKSRAVHSDVSVFFRSIRSIDFTRGGVRNEGGEGISERSRRNPVDIYNGGEVRNEGGTKLYS